MRTRLALLLLPAPLALAACEPPGGNTSLSINVKDDAGNVIVATDPAGNAKVKAGGFEASIKLPRIPIDAADFDADGVKLYPGSTIGSLDVNAEDRGAGKDKGRVAIAFEAPAGVDKVQAWFRDQLAQARAQVRPEGSGFVGTTSDGDAIRIELSADGADKARGRMTIGDTL